MKLIHILWALAVSPAWAQAQKAVELDNAAQTRLGLRTETLRAATFPVNVDAIAQVIDPIALARLDADLTAAQTTAAASNADLERAVALHAAENNVSIKAVQTARTQAATDSAKRDALLAELRLSWGSAFAAVPDAKRHQLVESLIAGRSVLVRIDPLQASSADFAPKTATLKTSQQEIRAAILGSAPQSTAVGIGRGWYALAQTSELVPGMTATAQLEDQHATVQGVLLPRASIVRWNGGSWAYVAVSAQQFERRPVQAARPVAQGWLLANGFRAGEHIVVSAAISLLAIDTGAARASED